MSDETWILWTKTIRGPRPQLLIRDDRAYPQLSGRESRDKIGEPVRVAPECAGYGLDVIAMRHPCPPHGDVV